MGRFDVLEQIKQLDPERDNMKIMISHSVMSFRGIPSVRQ
jgi:hypothetical protein